MPIGHMEGNYFCDGRHPPDLKAQDRIAFRYATPGWTVDVRLSQNGSLRNYRHGVGWATKRS